MAEGFILEIPEQVGIPTSTRRKPQAATHPWPAGTRIISAESHMLEADLWYDRFPEHLKDQAPRMVFADGGYDLRIGEKSMTPPKVAQSLCDALDCYPGFSDLEARLKDLDIEGVEKELIFPQRLFGLLMFGEIANREHVFGAYNEHLAEVCAQSGGRLFPVMIPHYWDMETVAASVERCKALGAKCLMIPIKPGKFEDGKPIHYNDPVMDPLWAAIEASGMPVAFHIGESIPTAAPGAVGVSFLGQTAGFRTQWAALTFTFGGIWEIQPHALEEVADRVEIIDVREPNEYTGALGHIAGARLIPLGQLKQRAAAISRDRPVVAVCRSGARSAQAVVMLQKEGIRDIANLSGGMLRWRAEGCAAVGEAE